MRRELRCEDVQELAPELALGIADGEERDAALRHLTGCASCRGDVSALTSAGEELLLLAPHHEPPLGFEERALARSVEPGPRRRRWPTLLAAATFAVLAAALAGGLVFGATAPDRELAASYRDVLRAGEGSFFAAAEVRSPDGQVGTMYGYQGDPSWVFTTIEASSDRSQRFRVELITRDGTSRWLGEAQLEPTGSAWGTALPVDLAQVSQIRFVRADGSVAFAALFDAQSPWR